MIKCFTVPLKFLKEFRNWYEIKKKVLFVNKKLLFLNILVTNKIKEIYESNLMLIGFSLVKNLTDF